MGTFGLCCMVWPGVLLRFPSEWDYNLLQVPLNTKGYKRFSVTQSKSLITSLRFSATWWANTWPGQRVQLARACMIVWLFILTCACILGPCKLHQAFWKIQLLAQSNIYWLSPVKRWCVSSTCCSAIGVIGRIVPDSCPFILLKEWFRYESVCITRAVKYRRVIHFRFSSSFTCCKTTNFSRFGRTYSFRTGCYYAAIFVLTGIDSFY